MIYNYKVRELRTASQISTPKRAITMPKKVRILIIDDCVEDMENIEAFLGPRFICTKAQNAEEAFNHLRSSPFQLVLLDIEFEGIDIGFDILSQISMEHPELPVIMVTKYYDADRIMKAVRLGAVHYVHKDEMALNLPIAIEKALNEAALYRAGRGKESPDSGVLEKKKKSLLDSFVGVSDSIKRLKEEIAKIAKTDLPVLITGETGTGKDHLARLIHKLSPRSSYPFVPIICAEYSPEFMNDELFGHVPGAFTGASRQRRGRLEEADRGTVFLNEIGEIDLQTQIKLLRAVEEGQFERLGSNQTISVDIRIIAATLKDIEKLVEEKKFRKDLYYRLNAHRLHIPPLRERREDIPVLIDHFIKTAARNSKVPAPRIRPEVVEAMTTYDWPGNVRELKISIERAILLAEDGEIGLKDIMLRRVSSLSELNYRDAMEQFKKTYILDLLDRCNWKVAKASEISGLAREYIYSLLKKWNIKIEK